MIRELNSLLNNSKYLNKKIQFIYAIKDDLFANKDKHKFFDYIIPVVPVMDYTNSYNKMKEFLKDEKIEDNVLTGIFNGKYQILIMDKLFEKRIKRLQKYVEGNNGDMYYHVNERYGDKITDKGVMSVGQFLKMCQKYQPVIKTRYKGLGELNADELRDTTLDPNNRILIRMTMDDVERELEIFNTLHGNDDAGRKLMMKHLSVSREDLDN